MIDLYNSLVAYWKLDEASGSRADSIGSHTLSDNNTVGSSTGLLYPLAGDFIAANSEYLSTPSSSSLAMGDTDFWIAAWVKVLSFTGNPMSVVAKDASLSSREYQLDLHNLGGATYYPHIYMLNNNVSNGQVTSTVPIVTGNWYFIVTWHSATNNQVGITTNGETPVIGSYSGGVSSTSSPLKIGRRDQDTRPYNGQIGPVMIGKGYIPPMSDFAYLYNNGLGRTLEEMAAFEIVEPDTSIEITSSTTWQVPAGVTQVIVEARGGGGGGGAGGTTVAVAGKGGGGGAYAKGYVYVEPEETYDVTVGSGGGGATAGANGGQGGSSSFVGQYNSMVQALGGGGGGGGNIGSVGAGGSAASSTGNIAKYSGGAGGSASSTQVSSGRGGGGGSGANSTSGGVAGQAGQSNGTGGAGGDSGGDGGDGGTGGQSATVATSGFIPGGGGGGGGSGSEKASAGGARGSVRISWRNPVQQGDLSRQYRGVLRGILRGAR